MQKPLCLRYPFGELCNETREYGFYFFYDEDNYVIMKYIKIKEKICQ